MESHAYQKSAWRRNRNKIIQLLNKEPLTFTKLFDKSGLSRAVVNEHLKNLVKENLVKKVYESGKILNVLQPSKLDLVEWFLQQLKNFDIPQEVLEKGRQVLSQEVLINSVVVYFYILHNTIEIVERHSKAESSKSKVLSKYKTKQIKLVFGGRTKLHRFELPLLDKETEEILGLLLQELNPYVFTIILVEYEFEKLLFEGLLPEETLLLKKKEEFFFPKFSNDLKKSFDKASEWWLNEIVENLPSSGFLQLWTGFYFNALLEKLKQ